MKRYDQQFKKEAIQLVLNQKRPVAAVARELGVHHTHKENAFPGSGNLRPDDKEFKLLQKRIADLEEENAILKKAAGIFAKHLK